MEVEQLEKMRSLLEADDKRRVQRKEVGCIYYRKTVCMAEVQDCKMCKNCPHHIKEQDSKQIVRNVFFRITGVAMLLLRSFGFSSNTTLGSSAGSSSSSGSSGGADSGG
ncbi:hypothetical protein ACFL52_03230 [Candidatus Margulisiibacteriota bacterium]